MANFILYPNKKLSYGLNATYSCKQKSFTYIRTSLYVIGMWPNSFNVILFPNGIKRLGLLCHGRTKLVFSLTPLRPNVLKGIKEADRLLSDAL